MRVYRGCFIPKSDLLYPSQQTPRHTKLASIQTPYTMQLISFLLFAAHTVQAIELSWYLGPSCTGEELYGLQYTSAVSCTTLDGATANAESLVVAFTTPADTGFEVVLYTDTSCKNKYEVEDSSVCVADEGGQVRAYEVINKPISKRATPISKRSPEVIQRGIDTLVANSGLDILPRADDEDLAPPKTYNIGVYNGSGPHTDLQADHPFIAATAFTVVTALSFTSLVTGCIDVGSASPIASYSCASSLAATSISFISALYHGYQSIRAIRATLRNNNIELGIRRPHKRGLMDETMTVSHEEYMEYILHLVGLEGKHLGYTQRYEHVDMKTPAYHFSIDGENDFVFTISADENREVKHSISFARDTKIHKRQGYEAVTVNGGLDVEACQRSAGNSGDLPTSAASAYSYFYNDLTCLVTSTELLNNNYLSSDVMDKSGKTVLTIGMSPYRSNQANEATARAACDNTHFYFSQTCVY